MCCDNAFCDYGTVNFNAFSEELNDENKEERKKSFPGSTLYITFVETKPRMMKFLLRLLNINSHCMTYTVCAFFSSQFCLGICT